MRRCPTPHYSAGREDARPEAIVVHTTVGSFQSVIDWFARPESGVSAHYLVGLGGELAQFVDEADTARHAGRVLDPTARLARLGNPNRWSIGIEFEDGGDPAAVDRPPSQYRAGARLIGEIAERWTIPLDRDHVIAHRELYAGKECPGNLDVDRLLAEARDTR